MKIARKMEQRNDTAAGAAIIILGDSLALYPDYAKKEHESRA
jgi:hypothetical protein